MLLTKHLDHPVYYIILIYRIKDCKGAYKNIWRPLKTLFHFKILLVSFGPDLFHCAPVHMCLKYRVCNLLEAKDFRLTIVQNQSLISKLLLFMHYL